MRRNSSVCCRSTCRVLLLSVMSRATFDMPMVAPEGALIGEMLSETSIGLPSLRRRTVSLCSMRSPQLIRRKLSCTSDSRSPGTRSAMFLPTTSVAEYPYRRSAAEFQPVIVPSSAIVMMASLDDSTAALNSRSRSAWWSRAATVRRCSATSRSSATVFAFTSSIACANARASTPVSPLASTGMIARPSRAVSWTVSVNRMIGRVSDRAISSASTAAHSTAINPTDIELFRIACAGAMKVAFGTCSITATHSLPARTVGANATPSRPPGWVRRGAGESLCRAERRCEIREVASPIGRPAELRTEFADSIGMNEVVASAVDHIHLFARPHR